LSDWAKRNFKSVTAKNEFYEKLGRRLQPAGEDQLRGLPSDVTPPSILERF